MNRLTKIKLAKTITYRILSSGIGVIIIFASTGSVKLSFAFSMFELVVKPLIYYVHEWMWQRKERQAVIKDKAILRYEPN